MTGIEWADLSDEQVALIVSEGQAEIARRARAAMLQDILAEHARSTGPTQPAQ